MRIALLLTAILPFAAHAAIPTSLPSCLTDDARTPIHSWAPSLNGRTLDSAPGAIDGDVFYIEFFTENSSADCVDAAADHLYSFDLPDADGSGLSVNLRGNVQFANGMCYISGFFMNEQVMGTHQGWTETYFRPLDKADVVTSGRFCVARSTAAGRNAYSMRESAVPEPDKGGQMTAGFLREICGALVSGTPAVSRAICGSYIRGVLEGMRLQAIGSKAPEVLCVPQSATISDVGHAYLRWHEEKRPDPNQLGAVSLGSALLATYPCNITR